MSRRRSTFQSTQWAKNAVASPAMGHWGTCPSPSTKNNFILVHSRVNLTANYPSIV